MQLVNLCFAAHQRCSLLCCDCCVGCGCAQVLEAKMRAVHDLNAQMGIEAPRTNVGIVIEGGALHAALDKGPAEDALMELCKGCKAVVCCRVTPMQKAEVRVCICSGLGGPWWLASRSCY